MSQDREENNWYALKVFYNKVFDIEETMLGMGLETYIPVKKERLKGLEHLRVQKRLATPDDDRNDLRYLKEGPVIYKRVPVVNSLLFVKADAAGIEQVRREVEGRAMVYLDAERKKPSVIPSKQMAIFRMVTSSGDEGLEFFSDNDSVNYRQGDRVRVLEGPLKGAEGYIKRIKKDRRLLVAIEGFIAVATSFIPPKLLEKVEEPEVSQGTGDSAPLSSPVNKY